MSALVAELAYAQRLGRCPERVRGSNPLEGTMFCQDCGRPSYCHLQTWLDELTSRFLLRLILPQKFELFFDSLLEKIFIFSGLASLRSDFTGSDIQMRSACFIEELKKRGAMVKALRGPAGYTNYFRVEMGGKIIRFENLPFADNAWVVDDKEKTKLYLRKGNFPIAEGKSFWFWQKKKACDFAMEKIGFPLVVKPRNGSVSRHVTTDIQTLEKLKKAVEWATIYSPAFIIEKFISRAFVYRATVIDFDYVACVKQVPANVVGDGLATIRELIDKKNSDPNRGEPHQKIVENETTDFLNVPKEGEVVFLQQDPFLKLGGDLIEMTPEVHPDNRNLFRQVAKFFNIRVVGIDFLARDISRSYKEQECAIIELNGAPCIELHHFPYSGAPQNVAKAVADLFFKYYL